MPKPRKNLGIAVGLVLLLAAGTFAVRVAQAISGDTPTADAPSTVPPDGSSPLSAEGAEGPVTTLTPAIPNWPSLARAVAANEIRLPGSGRHMVFTLAVVNTGADPLTLRFNTGQRYDFLVSDAHGREIWRWSSSRAFIQMVSEVVAAPRQLLAYSVIWDGKDDEGRPVAGGEYWVQGVLTTEPWAATEPVRFTWPGH
ncbi:MAG: hypothetical protein IMX00_03550 [Limnochordales bacterium]|nr:hypothetical protein [Limnochordales bacterium]